MFVLLVSISVDRGIRGNSRVSVRPFSQFFNLNNKKLSWPIEAFGYAFSVSVDSIWACGNMSRKCGHNLVFTSLLLEGLNSFYIFHYLPCLKAFPVFNVLETCRVYLLTIDLGILKFVKKKFEWFFE